MAPTRGKSIDAPQRIQERLRFSEERFTKLFEQAPLAIQFLSPDGRIREVNKAWQELWGIDDTMLNDFILKHYNAFEDPQLESKGLRALIQRAFAGETVKVPSALYNPAEIGKPGRHRWTDSVIYPIKDEHGQLLEVAIIHRDITDTKEAARSIELIAETASLLETSLDYEATLRKAAELSVKHFGGSCVIRLEDHKRSGTRLIARHEHAECASRVDALEADPRLVALTGYGPARAHASGKANHGPKIVEWHPSASGGDASAWMPGEEAERDEYLELLRERGFKSYLTVPLWNQGRVYGTLTTFSDRKLFTGSDLELAVELANRVSLGIQSAVLFEESQRAIRLRDDFLSIASHELKTPLTALNIQIQTVLKLVERGALASFDPEVLRGMFHSSADQIKSLSRLIDELLDVSRSEGRPVFKGRTEKFGLKELVQGVVARFQPQFSQVRVSVEGDSSVAGDWDRLRVEQIVVNLLSNAIKYGEGRSVELEVGASAGGMAVLKVTDHGIGIAPESRGRIFERFERAVPIQKFSGLGLGLYISSEIARAHQGSIRVESELGKGSTFVLELPGLGRQLPAGAEALPSSSNEREIYFFGDASAAPEL
jgi:PAS domain S-box-containing protein